MFGPCAFKKSAHAAGCSFVWTMCVFCLGNRRLRRAVVYCLEFAVGNDRRLRRAVFFSVDINESNRRPPTTPVPPAPITHPQVRAQGNILCCEFANSSVGRPLVGGAKEILRMSPCSPRDRKEPTNSLRNVRFLRTFCTEESTKPWGIILVTFEVRGHPQSTSMLGTVRGQTRGGKQSKSDKRPIRRFLRLNCLGVARKRDNLMFGRRGVQPTPPPEPKFRPRMFGPLIAHPDDSLRRTPTKHLETHTHFPVHSSI